MFTQYNINFDLYFIQPFQQIQKLQTLQKKFLSKKVLMNPSDIFPQLNKRQQHYFSEEQFEMMDYFKQFSIYFQGKQVSNSIKKSKKHFKLLNLKKGTVIYTAGSWPIAGYFLCHGSVVELIKKSTRQKLQANPHHVAHTNEQKANYLNQQFGIPINKSQHFFNDFYQQKVLFKYLQYNKLYGNGYFGFGQMLRNTMRAFTVITTSDTILLEIQKEPFETSLKDFQFKKEQIIAKNVLQNVTQTKQPTKINQKKINSSLSKQISLKFSQMQNFILIKKYQKDEVIYKQDQVCRSIYFILKGQVELSKSFTIKIPQKLIKDENKPQNDKQITAKVSRLSQKCYLGDSEIFLHIKNRQFTAVAIQNQTILISIQPMIFQKMISQFPLFQRQLIVSSKQKFSLVNQNFLAQKNKVVKAFLQQFQNIQNKKKQKIINDLIADDENHKNLITSQNSTTFQVFSKEGVFYRDTYEKLEGFQEFQIAQTNNKRAAIRKYKVERNRIKHDNEIQDISIIHPQKQSEHRHSKTQSRLNKQSNESIHKQFQNSKQKLLYSPRKNLNALEFLTKTQSPTKQLGSSHVQKSGQSKSKSRRIIDKFQQLAKDEVVFKRVLISNGMYDHDKSTFKSNTIKPIVHYKFDDVIKQCISRKNVTIRKAIGQKQNQVVKDNYFHTVESLKDKSLSLTKFSSFSVTCKGTEQFKKKLQTYQRIMRRSDSCNLIKKQPIKQKGLQACIGVNGPPKSSHQTVRNQITETKKQSLADSHRNQSQTSRGFGSKMSRTSTSWVKNSASPQKFVLLNHMMKPMTYSSIHY